MATSPESWAREVQVQAGTVHGIGGAMVRKVNVLVHLGRESIERTTSTILSEKRRSQ